MLNQLYLGYNQSLMDITVEIRGDPYWLGYSAIERRLTLNGGASPDKNSLVPNFQEGDNTFALVLRFPWAISDTSGIPEFRNDDVFNGLYRMLTVRHNFSGGQFTQTLQARKLELLMLPSDEYPQDPSTLASTQNSNQN